MRTNKIFIILVVILIIRLIFQIIFALSSSDIYHQISYVIVAILYATSLFGLFKKMSWAGILTIVVAVLDILFSSNIGGQFGVGAAVVDLPLIGLGYWAYKNMKK